MVAGLLSQVSILCVILSQYIGEHQDALGNNISHPNKPISPMIRCRLIYPYKFQISQMGPNKPNKMIDHYSVWDASSSFIPTNQCLYSESQQANSNHTRQESASILGVPGSGSCDVHCTVEETCSYHGRSSKGVSVGH